jgi:pimeloyl-ACP methyl ester carboxylesterase
VVKFRAVQKAANVEIEHNFVNVAGHSIDTAVLTPRGGAVKDHALFLHGAGESTKDRWIPLAKCLAARGWRCVSFSFPGHGSSSGQLHESSLAERTEVADTVGRRFDMKPDSLLVAASMGAHIAVSLVARHPQVFNRLVLFVPAIYTHRAEKVAFGPEFTKVIREPGSYRDSKQWDILRAYSGRLATVAAGKDEIIPTEVLDLIRESAPAGADWQHATVPGSDHRINLWLAQKPARLEAVCGAIDRFDFSGLADLA